MGNSNIIVNNNINCAYFIFVQNMRHNFKQFSSISCSFLSHVLTNRSVPSNSAVLVMYHLLTPCSTVLLENLTYSQVVKKFPAFYGTRRFITVFASARHLFLSWASTIQPITLTSHFLKIHLNIILPSTPGSPSVTKDSNQILMIEPNRKFN
jgi:hypothetical protein